MSRISRRARRAAAIVAALAVGITAAIALAVPAGVFAESQPLVAGIVMPQRAELVSDRAYYQGWATVYSGQQYCARLAVGMASCDVTAWRWNTRYGWQQSSRPGGLRVYVWPYGSGWSWTWTSTTGWMAMRSDKLAIQFTTVPVIAT